VFSSTHASAFQQSSEESQKSSLGFEEESKQKKKKKKKGSRRTVRWAYILQFLLAIYVAQLGWLCLRQPFSCSNSTRKPRQFRSDSNECDNFPALQR
jgi:hypothetical protein